MPYTTRADGDVITASSWNANVRDQVISTVTNATRPAGTEGQIIYETDTDRCFIYNGGWIQFGGAAAGATNSHTPQVDQGATTNIAKTVVYSQYQQIGNLCWWSFSLNLTAAGTATNQVTVTTPVTLASSSLGVAGNGAIYDASVTTYYNGMWIPASTTTLRLYADVTSNAAWGVNPNVALASGDVIRGAVWLPVA